METTASSSPSNRIFDPVRRRFVACTPEERVRQALIQLLLDQGVPSRHLLVEIALDRLPCGRLASCRANRRIDLLVARFEEGVFAPYLLVECKARSATEADLSQLLTYQSAIKSRWLALATPDALWVYDTQAPADTSSSWSHALPSFLSLCS